MHTQVNSLPLDILEDIFLVCVFWDATRISPLVLTAVCHRWRHIALHLGRLWGDIDMSKSTLAKYFFQLSQDAPLDVTWCERTLPNKWDVYRDNVRSLPSYVDRFRVLVIHSDRWRHEATRVYRHLSHWGELSRLQALIFNATDEACKLSRRTIDLSSTAVGVLLSYFLRTSKR